MAADDHSGWCLIESDPGVFSELVELLGVRGVAFAEVYGLDKEAFQALEAEGSHRKVLGFIFLFNWGKDKLRRSSGQPRAPADSQPPPDLFFAAQAPGEEGRISKGCAASNSSSSSSRSSCCSKDRLGFRV
ncbi:ubiquitin carboxyl-terminal hydrolase isozyme L5, putative [Eimeria necatrix]|uniref:ubiquitinyl hydrolase 1 n=1 Tax=Eimeria necatrix TaxID=51315 RepID=U6MI00_9EIME|nr:ubiquitin carboxyl-terminal hydrolase isozyme L5, putative [Eimeria necatrix]CDJ62059.1 ubiquitin carboxyl-terminal hydrolase isozyme L5, putative [Eimeria necatrix]